MLPATALLRCGCISSNRAHIPDTSSPASVLLPPALSPCPRCQVNYFLSALIELKSNDLYRMKGVLAIRDFDRRFVFQVGG